MIQTNKTRVLRQINRPYRVISHLLPFPPTCDVVRLPDQFLWAGDHVTRCPILPASLYAAKAANTDTVIDGYIIRPICSSAGERVAETGFSKAVSVWK